MNFLRLLLATLAAALLPIAAAAQDDLSPQRGEVVLPGTEARIDLGDELVFYGPRDTRTILLDYWDNPPAEADGVLGLVMPADASPRDRSWGAVVTYEAIGWVSADNARATDYDAMLAEMQARTRESNAARRRAGYATVELVGWAQEPVYDSVAHSLTWARELAFADAAGEANTLHYDMRVLGRYGVVSLNIVGTTAQLPEIRAAASDLSGRVTFEPGAQYEDFDEDKDEAASYGMAGLVATGAGLAVAKNLGAFAVIAKLAQPVGFALLAFAILLATPFRRLLGKRKPAEPAATR